MALGVKQPACLPALAGIGARCLPLPCIFAHPPTHPPPPPTPLTHPPYSHLVRAALLEAVQGKLAGDEVAAEAPHTSAGKRLRRQAAAAGRRIPLLLRAREPPLEARIQKAEAKTAAAAAVAAGGGCVGQGATADGADAPQAAEGAGDEEPGPAGGAARAAPDSVLAKQSVTGVSL